MFERLSEKKRLCAAFCTCRMSLQGKSSVAGQPASPIVLRRRETRYALDTQEVGMPCLGQRFLAQGMIVDLNTADPFAANFETPELVFSLQLSRREYEIGIGTDKMIARHLMPGAVSLSPKGSTVRARSGPVDAEFLAFAFEGNLVMDAVEASGLKLDAIRIEPELYHRDLLALGNALRGFMLAPDQSNEIYGETLALAVLLAVVGGLEQEKRPRIRNLASNQLSLVLDYIEENLSEGCKLSDLAALANLNVYSFTRAFRKATNLTPHKYVMERRIAKARDMLTNSPESVADISYAVGFASQPHMTDVFRKQLGVTPGKYRDQTSK